MASPIQITDQATAPRSKNSTVGTYRYESSLIPLHSQLTYSWTVSDGQPIGNAAGTSKTGISFIADRTGPVGLVYIPLARIVAPSDNDIFELRTDDGAGLPSTTILGSVTIAATSVPAALVKMMLLDFTASGATLTQGTRYHVTASRSGSVNGTSYLRWMHNLSSVDANTYRVSFSTTSGLWTQDTTKEPGILITEAGVTQRILVNMLSDEPNNLIEAWVSTDEGQNWAVGDPVHSRPVLNDNTKRSFEASLESPSVIMVGSLTTTSSSEQATFDMQAGIWITRTGGTIVTFAHVSGVAPLFAEMRTSDTKPFYAFNGVLDATRRRAKMVNQATQIIDIITGTTTPAVGAYDTDVRWFGEGDSSDMLYIYSKSDTTSLQFKRYTSANVLGAAVALPGAHVQGSAYPVGIGTIYTDRATGFKWFAIPFVDAVAGKLKVLRCRANANMDTASNWTIEDVVTEAIEVTNSNPAVLVPDAVDGSKLWLFYVPSGRASIKYTHDKGSAQWITPITYKPSTMTVGQLNARLTPNLIHLSWLDETPTPDRVMYDFIPVIPEQAYTADTPVPIDWDFGPSWTPLTVGFLLNFPGASGATSRIAFSGRGDFYNEMTEYGETAVEGAVDSEAIYPVVDCPRYVRALVTAEGASAVMGGGGSEPA